jgi:sulfite reductase (NADPH) hemoprotein beta-component
MPAVEEPRALGRSRLGFADVRDVEEFVETLGRYERGELTSDQWRTFRLVRGTYGQRQPEASMLRAKLPQGVLDGAQLRALADVADRYSRGFGHVTTRQNMQFHFMRLADVDRAMARLAEAGITTREACGNAVRNVTACPLAGVSRDEAFDVAPYAEALTRHLLRHPLSSTLPRKFKIGFEGCAEDHALTAINDLGFRALLSPGGERAFRVTAGGGTAILCTSGSVLCEALPAADILDVAEAVLRVFSRLGDYQHRQRNRMKFLIKSLGWDRFRGEFEAALAELRAGASRPVLDDASFGVESEPIGLRTAAPRPEHVADRVESAALRGPGLQPQPRPVLRVVDAAYARWIETNVLPQKQAGYAVAAVTLPLGDVTGAQLRILAELAAAYGDGTVRTTLDQDLLMRWVRHEALPELYRRLAAAGLGEAEASTSANVTSCPGAEACRLAVTQSRGLGRLLAERMASRPDLVAAAPDLKLKISGCPNGCGQHHVAGLGFQGSLRRVGGRAVPQYFVMVGGGVDSDGAHFGRTAAKIPARRVPEAVERLIALYARDRRDGESAAGFLRRVELARVKELLADLEPLAETDAAPDDFVDLAEEKPFEPETMGGECSA